MSIIPTKEIAVRRVPVTLEMNGEFAEFIKSTRDTPMGRTRSIIPKMVERRWMEGLAGSSFRKTHGND
jgi:hypothetical protein